MCDHEQFQCSSHFPILGDPLRRTLMTTNIYITNIMILCSALNPVCYHLVPLLFMSGILAAVPTISLHLLDVDAENDSLLALKMEVEDMAVPQLHKVTVHTDLSQAFQQADLVVLLDDQGSNEQQMSRAAERFRHYGRLIEDNSHKDLRVLVAGGFYVNLKCGLLIENAPSVDPHRFVAIATQLEGEVRTQLAMQLSVKSQGEYDSGSTSFKLLH